MKQNSSQAGQGGASTAFQTAWALLGLMSTGDFSSVSLRRGFEYLTRTQREDGSWVDEFWTATGFPKVFYLRYHLYATYFPVQALGRYLYHSGRQIPLSTVGSSS